MNKEIKLVAQSSGEGEKAQQIRKAGFVPVNIYGYGLSNKNIKVKDFDFKRIFDTAGESRLIDLTIDNEPAVKVIIKGVQRNPVRDNIIHVDLYQVDMNKKITTEIPLHFTGESKAVKELGGTLIKTIDRIEVECLPEDLVDNIEVDLSGLENFYDAIKMSDLNLSQGLGLLHGSDTTVVSVIPPIKEEEVKTEKGKEEVAVEEGAETGKEDKKEEEKQGEEKKK